MTDTMRIGEAAAVLGVSPSTVRRLIDRGSITASRSHGGQRLVASLEVAALAASPSPGRQTQSARNRFAGIVTRVVRDRVTAQVEIQSGRHRLVSVITREAADQLGLRPGVAAIAVVKATDVTIELGRR